MPSVNTMTKRLGATPLPLRQQRVLFRFVSLVADQEETGSSLVAAWESACQGTARKFRQWQDKPIIRLLHIYSFPGVVDAIVSDREVANTAKEELRFLEEIRA